MIKFKNWKPLLLIFVMIIFTDSGHAQCSQKLDTYYVKSKYSEENELLLEIFKAKLRKQKYDSRVSSNLFQIVLYKGFEYRLVIIDPPGFEGRSKIEIIDDKKVIATSYQDDNHKQFSSFYFNCNCTKKYSIRISYKKGRNEKKGCATGMLLLVF